MKQLDQERRKKKGEEKMQLDTEQANMSFKQEKDLEIKTDDLVVSYLYDVLLLLEFLSNLSNLSFNIENIFYFSLHNILTSVSRFGTTLRIQQNDVFIIFECHFLYKSYICLLSVAK